MGENDDFDLQEYITAGVENFVKSSLKTTLKNPRESAFLVTFARAAQKASKYRKKREEEGIHIPAFLITSITGKCNLHCEGCYSRSTHETVDDVSSVQLTDKDWGDIFIQAQELGISFIVLAGGEPLLRRGVIEEAAKTQGIMFPVFTNGTFLDVSFMELFNRHRNLLPVLSLEGDREVTDKRRGDGVYDRVISKMTELKKRGVVFGASVTVTKKNLKSAFSDVFIEDISGKGAQFLFFTEYVPVGGVNATEAPDDNDREYIKQRVSELRTKYEDMVFVSIPGDEKASGGCLAAGRGFFHINSKGDAEACPMSPFSDVNVRDRSLEEALRSRLFTALKEKGLLSIDHRGGCALAGKEDEIKKYCDSAFNNDE